MWYTTKVRPGVEDTTRELSLHMSHPGTENWKALVSKGLSFVLNCGQLLARSVINGGQYNSVEVYQKVRKKR